MALEPSQGVYYFTYFWVSSKYIGGLGLSVCVSLSSLVNDKHTSISKKGQMGRCVRTCMWPVPLGWKNWGMRSNPQLPRLLTLTQQRSCSVTLPELPSKKDVPGEIHPATNFWTFPSSSHRYTAEDRAFFLEDPRIV